MTFDPTIIQADLSGVVGFRTPQLPEFDNLSTALTSSSSGIYVQDIHPLLKVEILQKLQSYPDITNSDFNSYLEQLQNAAIVKLCNSVFTESGVIENGLLYDEIYHRDTLQDNDGSFVGFEIVPEKRKDRAVIINSVNFMFSEDCTIKLLLFNTNKSGIVDSKEVSVTGNDATAIELDWYLPYSGDYAGGRWYIGYLNGALGSAKAYNRDDGYEHFNHASIYPVKIDGRETETIWDYEDLDYGAYNYGLNLDISTVRDFTDIIVRNKNLFADGIALQFAAMMLEEIAYSTRNNDIEREMKAQAALALQGNSGEIEGLSKAVGVIRKLNRQIELMRERFVEMDKFTKGTLR